MTHLPPQYAYDVSAQYDGVTYPPQSQPYASAPYEAKVSAIAHPAIQNTQIQPGGRAARNNIIDRDEQDKSLRRVCNKLGIPSYLRDRMRVLRDYDVVMIIDNSGSMTHRDGELKKNGYERKSRWEELAETVVPIVDLVGCLDEDGISIYTFTDRYDNISKASQVKSCFNRRPDYPGTPLCATFERVIRDYNAQVSESKKPLYVMIATDGAPRGPGESEEKFRQLIENQYPQLPLPEGIGIQIIACTEGDEVDYLSRADRNQAHLDVTDDYRSERDDIRKNKGRKMAEKFTKPVWIGKTVLGGVCPDFDNLDELATATDVKAVNKKFVFGSFGEKFRACFGCRG